MTSKILGACRDRDHSLAVTQTAEICVTRRTILASAVDKWRVLEAPGLSYPSWRVTQFIMYSTHQLLQYIDHMHAAVHL